MLVDLQTERALHVSLRAGDQKRQGNYRVKDAMEISVKELMPFFFFFLEGTQSILGLQNSLKFLVSLSCCREEKVNVLAVCKRFLFDCCVSSFNSVNKLVN